ncbi:hypothetical protein L249_8353 [Ophiocordyceps polyrhachis-furcata BCC 54312]|uniref:DNA-directed RNA polymerase subunit n=1 Tax=Ophiocordyceps polyrhachis-furcata BCC 54312 TaxID=1330021 RepID=A0A367L1F2_9HYPO|nr:hypothetical protein L249_8353 [Ophiocordyceps polyrhachis-furcata BCC 54312]
MNIAQPISSELDSVDFTLLSVQEVQAISVKCIENECTLDNLLNPSPGGLYDPALGSWGEYPCSTCNLNQVACPGHPGHIQLPVPVYHPVFMDQAYRLLRATCVFCHGFRLSQKDIHMFSCKFRLLQHGLVNEAYLVGCISENDLAVDLQEDLDIDDDQAGVEGDIAMDNVIRTREAYVQRLMLASKSTQSEETRGKHECVSGLRRELMKAFFHEANRSKRCANCGGISPAYRKDRCVKIFERELTAKEKAIMAQKSLRWDDAMSREYQARSKKRNGHSPTEDSDGGMDIPDRQESQPCTEDLDLPETNSAESGKSQRYISSMEVKARLAELFHKEQDILRLLYNARPPTRDSQKIAPDMFFISAILVPPNRFRPEARTGDSKITEAPQNSLFRSILRGCGKFAQTYGALESDASDLTQVHQAWADLQEAVNSLIDKSHNPVQGYAAKRIEDGIKQQLEKKEGLFRMNMMGKRVNFAARSVISPDPNIETNEIGVPPVFAKKLTYPEPVTSHNFRDMHQAVLNGVEKWPGAFAVENEQGQVVSLRNKSDDDRLSLANQLLAPTNSNAARTSNKKVYRHLTNGDVVLMNRQPTLHKPSIMGHRVRVLPGEKTIRMHYANCNTYNADFDGDEMNLHFPQNEVARAEALQIADTDHQYLSATAGKPLRGLIQDHISVSVAICNRDAFFSRGDYQQLIYAALRPESGHIMSDRLQLLPPAILKPLPRWTGKQIFTTILLNIRPLGCGGLTMSERAQIKAEQWGPNSEEGRVLIQDGHFISGVLDKSQIGHSAGGLVHAVHETYGPAFAGKLLSSLGRLLTRYLHMRAFSCGIDDLRLTKIGESARQQALQSADRVGLKIASTYVSFEQRQDPSNVTLFTRLEEVFRDDTKQKGLDLLMNRGATNITDAVLRACIPSRLEKLFPGNQMQTMTTSGAKGSMVNASLITCNLGQQVLEGRRVPLMVSGKSLPSFKPFETNIRAGGYVVNRFLTGIRPQEYYFHHMAGREGLIDTAVKTSRSGYLQRCLIKGMEGLVVAYDNSVRDSDGSLVQFLYGEDGLDVTKQKYLADFKFILENVDAEAAQLRYDEKVGENLVTRRADNSKWMKSALKHADNNDPKHKDPLISVVNPATNAFATSEAFYWSMINFLKANADGLIKQKVDGAKQTSSRAAWHRKLVTLNRKNAELLFALKYLKSLMEPGEAVGIVAGQSVGEPSTQMTLNTFHLAGHSAKNVTLGIPRLREILMTASRRISTPSMTLFPISELSSSDFENFSKSIGTLYLNSIIDRVDVEERSGRGKMFEEAKMYHVSLKFFPAKEYKDTYAVSVIEVMDAVEKRCLQELQFLIRKEFKTKKVQDTAATPLIGVKAGVVEIATGGVGDDGAEDATEAKQRAYQTEAVSYGPNDEEDDALQMQNETGSTSSTEGEDIDDSGRPAPESITSRPNVVSSVEDEEDGSSLSTNVRAQRILRTHLDVTHFESDERGGQWCNMTFEFEFATPKVLMLNVVHEAVRKTVVRHIPRVNSCSLDVGNKSDRVAHTEGVNLQAMWICGDTIDLKRLRTNDIGAMLDVYGVEACRGNIVLELTGVFESHGIKVDNRHLNLIADYMTRNGSFTPFNRVGLQGNVSPFTKMSFETTVSCLKDAILEGEWDNISTPSSCLVMGKLGRVGTGGFDVLTRLPTHSKEILV